MTKDSTLPQSMEFTDYGHLYMFRMSLDWEVVESYKRQITPEECGFRILTHVFDAMTDWCKNHARGRWWTDGILGIGFTDQGDAIRFRLTFCTRNPILDRMFTDRKHTYSEH
jgi:hypothetical protein